MKNIALLILLCILPGLPVRGGNTDGLLRQGDGLPVADGQTEPSVTGRNGIPMTDRDAEVLVIGKESVSPVNIEVTEADSAVTIAFEMEVPRRALRGARTLVFMPRITDGEHTVCFRPLVVRGRRAVVGGERHRWAADGVSNDDLLHGTPGYSPDLENNTRHGIAGNSLESGNNAMHGAPVYETGIGADALYARPGEAIRYRAEVPLQGWMRGARLEAGVLVAGCCTEQEENLRLTGTVLPPENPAVSMHGYKSGAMPGEIVRHGTRDTASDPENTAENSVSAEPTVAEQLAEVFPFVLPSSEFYTDNPTRLYDDDRESSIIVYYHINRYDIDEQYAGNRQTLLNLRAAIDLITASLDSRISRVFVAGFASPEGPHEVNDRLAWERAVSVREFITANTGLDRESITLYNGSSDWQGLRLLVLRDEAMPARDEVLDILDNHPVWDSRTSTGRTTRLRALRGGEVYRYMAENIFPKLRNGAFIRVYYENGAP